MFPNLEKHRIDIFSGLILLALTLAAGISVFVVMQRQAETLLSNDLASTLRAHLRTFDLRINESLSDTQLLTTHPNLIKNMQSLASDPGNAAKLVGLQEASTLFLMGAFTGLSIYDARGHEVARAGKFSQKHALRVPLKTKLPAFLLWDGQFILQASSDIIDQQGRRIGMVTMEVNLPLVTAAFSDIASIGTTGEFAVCAPLADDEKNMDCFLSRIAGKEFKPLARVVEGKPLPMNHALNGETGIIFTQDYRRQQVVAVYAPVGSLGLGIVLKQDKEELYSAVAGQLKFVVLLLAALVIIGMLLLHVLVRPLLRKLVDSERAARDANALLHEHAERLRFAVQASNVGLWDWDLVTNQVVYSREWKSQLGYEETELRSEFSEWERLVHPDDLAAAQEIIQRYLARPEGVYEAEFRMRHKDGTWRWIYARGEVFRDASGVATRMMGCHMDLTERKQAEEEIRQLNENLETKVLLRTAELERTKGEAEQANRAKSEFLAAMSHEIRTPMNGVIGMVDVLQQSNLEGHQVEMVDTIRESAFSLLAIIDDILDFSKIEAGKLEIGRAPTDIAEVVEKVCSMLDRLALKMGVELTLFTDPALPATVVGDALRLRQVLVNLASNAIKFSSGMGRTGRVSVRAVLAGSGPDGIAVDIRVTDNGIGMDAPTQARLFTAFGQADASTTRRFGGSGLGLAIARNLAKLMGGDIAVQSAPDAGSTFTLRLPCAPVAVVETPAGAAAGTSTTASPVAGLSCLVLGGADSLAEDFAAYLAHGGARVLRAADLAAARAHLAALAPGQWIAVIDATGAAAPVEELRAVRPDLDVQFVVIGRGMRRKPRRRSDGRVAVDGNVLTRAGLLASVAIAAGRAREEETPAHGRSAAVLLPPAREAAVAQGRLILVAEDNTTNQKVIVRQLALLGFAADVAADGREALEHWQRGDYGLLLTDLHMPRIDGYQLAEAIRAAERGARRIPIIALTANALKGEAENCRAAGMDDYLSKPAQLADLKAMLEKWLPTAAEGLPTSAALDVSVLAALVGDDPATLREFLLDFRASATGIAAELRTACAAGQATAAGAAAHKLKSSARSVGALALGELCAEMEQAGKASQVGALTALLPRFEAEMAGVDEYLGSL